MKCTDCPYYYKTENDKFPCCHWESRCPDDKAPCEEEEYETEDVDN